jgi:hypothetical protein
MNMTIYEYKSRCEWLAAFYKEAAETGRGMQVFNDGPRVWEDCNRGPNMESIPDNWRIKPEPQKAWVVWGPGGPSTILGESHAKQYARECGGTIQEITRPEPQ